MKKRILSLFIAISTLLTSNGIAVAATGIGCGSGFGPIAELLCGNSDNTKVGISLNKIISTVVGVMTAAAAIYFIFQFIQGGFGWITSGGDKNNLQQSRDRIINATIGLIIVVSAWAVIGVIGKILGLDILNPGSLLLNLGK
ncbi:hypothetical protein HY029_05655 [Candidatus Gottesmanbacteria bacterium]|nr:hypothetical protein [Candidatus Gottesmanbacteria bacterium]